MANTIIFGGQPQRRNNETVGGAVVSDTEGDLSSGNEVGSLGNAGQASGPGLENPYGTVINPAPPPPVAAPAPIIDPNVAAERDFQRELIDQLHRLAMGDRNSAAQQGLHGAYGRANAQASSLSNLRRSFGGNAAAGQDMTQQQGNLAMQENGQSAMLMLQQQRSAQQALSQALSQMRAGDIGWASGMANAVNGQNNLDFETALGHLTNGITSAFGQTANNSALARTRLGISAADTARSEDAVRALLGGIGAGVGAFATSSGKGASAPNPNPIASV